MLAVAQNKKYVNIDILILFGYILKTTYPSSTRGDIQTPGVGRISRPRAGFFTSMALEGANKQWIWKVLTFFLLVLDSPVIMISK